MNRKEVETYLDELKEMKNIRVYTPYKYFKGLTTKTDIKSRFQEIVKRKQSLTNYQPFKTDISKSTKPSTYTTTFRELYGRMPRSIEQKSEITGVPHYILKKVFDKGKSAWRTGHRVGATPEQWGYARVHSFLTLGCTVFSADFHLFEEALKEMKPKDIQKWLSLPVKCPRQTLNSPHYKSRNTVHKFLLLYTQYVK